MSQMKRISGSGKKPYVWKDTLPARRPSQGVRGASVYPAPVKRTATAARRKTAHGALNPKLLIGMLLVVVAVGVILTVMTILNTTAEKSRLESLSRKNRQLEETLQATSRTLDMETRRDVICQLANEKLFMQFPSQSVALNVNGGGDGQTAGR